MSNQRYTKICTELVLAPEEFDPSKEYTNRELEAFANGWLKSDIRENGNTANLLFADHHATRIKREVFNKLGVPDDTLTAVGSPDGQRIFNRTHPEGRGVNTKEQRQNHGAAFYKN